MKNFSLKTAGFFLIAILFIFIQGHADAQADDSSEIVAPNQFDMTGFPQWSKDLRRGEIIAFGSFPFAYFFTNFGIDTYRYATHDWNKQYAPWPIKGAGAIELSQHEQFRNLGIAAGGSVLIAVIDHLIVRYKRNKAAEKIRNLPEGTPIIIRTPFDEEETIGEETVNEDTAEEEGAVNEEMPPPYKGES
jgi:hypothetical protein